jgi:hypothetical protein
MSQSTSHITPTYKPGTKYYVIMTIEAHLSQSKMVLVDFIPFRHGLGRLQKIF